MSWFGEIRGRVPRIWAIVLGAVPILALFIAWWMATNAPIVEERAIPVTLLPNPSEVFSPHILRSLLTDSDLFQDILLTMRRIALGYLLAAAIVLPLGVLMGSFGSARAMFTPIATASGYVPIIMLIPMFMAVFKTGELQKVVFLTLAFGVYLLPLVAKAIASVPDTYLRTGMTLGANRKDIILRVLVPIALPDIFHAMRLAFGVGWTYVVLVEIMTGIREGGLGDIWEMGRRRGPIENSYLVLIVITMIAWLADLGWGRLGRLLFPYRSNGE